ncbi:carboxymuconolactone decarboxylase family protein [Halorientalis salina]|uniref:carboxymuconolactone decarboxylase family protein n=1 Tax=Halorientalis salina TaxID=2932266 RepID=UPI0010AD7F6E|nr:carboxymuconolactone decarboxylase family protein [Halorientalis salina]
MTTETVPTESGFKKKHYTARSLLAGVGRFVHNVPRLVRAKRADRVSDRFAEKIMLAVTAVNECQYCTRYHTELARETGVDLDTIDHLLESDIEGAVDEGERQALLFAQAYAEANENPGPETVAKLREAYGPAKAADVQAFVRAIYFGNLAGNTYDAVRYAARQHTRRARHCLRDAVATVRDVVERVRDRCPI